MIWYSDKLDDVVRELNTDLAQGLSDSEAAVRLQEHGSNRLNEKKPRSFLQRFLDQMKDVMIIILLIAALISLGLQYLQFHPGSRGRLDRTDRHRPHRHRQRPARRHSGKQSGGGARGTQKHVLPFGKGTAGRRDAEHPLHRPCARGYRRHRGGGSGSGRLPAAVQRQLQM